MKPALLLIDLQLDFLATPDLQPDANALVSRVAILLKFCRERRVPVFHIWTTVERGNDNRLPHWRKKNRWMCVAGTPGHETPNALQPLAGEIVINKTGFNSFNNGELEKGLRTLGCDAVILSGLHLHACVRTAAVESLERNFQVFIAEDAVASNDPIHATATRRWLSDRCVAFEFTSALIKRLDGSVSTTWFHRSPRRTRETLFEVTNAQVDEIDTAADAGQSAWTKWRHVPISQRKEMLDAVARCLEKYTEELARQMAVEIGKPIRHAREEIHRAAANVRDVGQRALVLSATKRESAGLVRYESLGVVGIISAWNNPVAIPMGKIAPALIYGNTVVWKPAPATKRIAENVTRLVSEAGVPVDVLRLVNGDHTTAQFVAANGRINAVTLTGSLAAGRAMQEICARRLVPLQAELSGNNAAIVWDDADLSSAAAQIAWGAFAFAGQRCTANRRVIIHAPLFENFVRELASATARLRWGDPLDAETEIGPVLNVGKRDELESLVKIAEADGAAHRVVRPFSFLARETWVKDGAYAEPVIVCCDKAEHVIVQEETMSPLLVVQRAGDFDHALNLCNGVRHGLIASLFSESPDRQRRFLDEARAGILKINSSTAGVDVTLPFGGWKASGIGPPEHGNGDFQFYTHMQAVYGIDG